MNSYKIYKRTLKPQKRLKVQEWTNFHILLRDHSNNEMPCTSTLFSNNLGREDTPDTCQISGEENMKCYLDLVEHKLWDKPEIYYEFLNTMQKYNSGYIDRLSFSSRVYDLFKKYPDLIVMYNNIYLPCFKQKIQPDEQGHISQESNKVLDSMKHFTMSSQRDSTINSKCKSDFSNFQINNNDTTNFIKLLQHQSSDKSKIYHEFLYILHEYEMRRMSVQTVNTRLSDLFKKYPNIITKFNSRNQPCSKSKVQPRKQVVEPGPMITHPATSSQYHNINSLQREIYATFLKLTQDAMSFSNLVQQQYKDRPEVYNKFVNIIRKYVLQPKNDCQPVITRICDLFKESPYVILNFKKYLPPGYDIEIQMEPGRCVYQVQSHTSNSYVMYTGTLLQPNNNNMTTIESPQLDSSFMSSSSVQSTETSYATYKQDSNDCSSTMSDSSHHLSLHDSSLSSESTYTSHSSNAQTQTVNQPLKQKVGVLTRAMRRKSLVQKQISFN